MCAPKATADPDTLEWTPTSRTTPRRLGGGPGVTVWSKFKTVGAMWGRARLSPSCETVIGLEEMGGGNVYMDVVVWGSGSFWGGCTGILCTLVDSTECVEVLLFGSSF